MVGEYEIQEKEDGAYVKKYGLKAFSADRKRVLSTVIMMISGCQEAMDIRDSIWDMI